MIDILLEAMCAETPPNTHRKDWERPEKPAAWGRTEEQNRRRGGQDPVQGQ